LQELAFLSCANLFELAYVHEGPELKFDPSESWESPQSVAIRMTTSCPGVPMVTLVYTHKP
jgi:hypothetical protein